MNKGFSPIDSLLCPGRRTASVPEATERRRRQRLGEGDNLSTSGRQVTRGPRPWQALGLLLLRWPLGSRVCQRGMLRTPPLHGSVLLLWHLPGALQGSGPPGSQRASSLHVPGPGFLTCRGLRLSRKKNQCSQSLRPLPAPGGCGSATASLHTTQMCGWREGVMSL